MHLPIEFDPKKEVVFVINMVDRTCTLYCDKSEESCREMDPDRLCREHLPFSMHLTNFRMRANKEPPKAAAGRRQT